MISLSQLREFEESCLKPRVTGQVIVRGDKENPKNKPDIKWHATQSYYFMPLITEAYYRAQGKDVPQEILNMSGRITGLPVTGPISMPEIVDKSKVDELYEDFVLAIIKYLLKDGNLDKLTKEYKKDRKPTENSPGHINGKKQEEILKKSGIINDNEVKNPSILNTMITNHGLSLIN